MGRVPVAGQHFEWQGHRFEVMDMDGNRVDKVLVTLLRNRPLEGNGDPATAPDEQPVETTQE
jgi:putative hemolysin